MRILVAFDASPGADDAILDLRRAGLPRDAEARVVSVCTDCLPGPGEASSAARFGARHGSRRSSLALEHAAGIAAVGEKHLRAQFPGWNVSHGAVPGDACDALLDEAEAWRADLIVLGAHAQRPTAAGPVFGSVARRIVRDAPCSVRVGRAGGPGAPSRPVRVLVGYDASAGSDAAVAAAAARVWPAGSAARVVVAVDPVIAQADAPSAGDETGIPWGRLRERAAGAAGRLAAAGLSSESDVTVGDGRRLLAEEAARWRADVLFVGARGSHGPERPLLGSVATAAVTRSPCTVEVIRPAEASST